MILLQVEGLHLVMALLAEYQSSTGHYMERDRTLFPDGATNTQPWELKSDYLTQSQ
jgi:hypothetical protein